MASSSAAPAHQQPTCTDTFVRSVADVHKIFYAVLLGRLPLITRRLDAAERDALRTGSCYVWEDRGPHSVTGLGIERFTEGRHWSASRVRDDFLYYYQRYKGGSSTTNPSSNDDSDKPPRGWDPLVKQTYSVYVNPNPGQPEPNPPKKWHLTAYYTESSIDGLKAVNSLPECADLVVPEGMFRCSRSVKPRSRAGKAKAARERALREKSGESGTGATATGGSAVKVKREEAAAGASEKAVEKKPGRLVKKPPPQQQTQPIAGPSRVKSERTSPPLRDLRVDTDLGPETRTPIAPLSAPATGFNNRLAGSNIASPATAHFVGSNIAGSNIQSPSAAHFSGSNIGSASSHLAGSNIQSGSNVQANTRPLPSHQSLSLYDPTNQNSNTNANNAAPQQDPSYPFSSSSGYASTNTQPSAFASPIYPSAPPSTSPTSAYPPSATSPTSGYFGGGSPQPFGSQGHFRADSNQQQQQQGHFRADSSGQHQQHSQQHPFRPPSQQAFRPTSSLAGALDPDAVGNASKPGSRRSSMNYAAPSFSAAAQRMGSFVGMSGPGSSHSLSPSPPHTGSVGSIGGGAGSGLGVGGTGTMMPPPLPPLGVNASGMDVGSVDVSMGSTPTPAPSSSSLDAAMGPSGLSAGAADGFAHAQAASPVHRFPTEHTGAGTGDFTGFPAPAPAPQPHAPAQEDTFNVSSTGYSAGYGAEGPAWGEQQQQPPPSYNEYGGDTYMADAHHVSNRSTFFPAQSPFSAAHSAYAPSPNPSAAYAFASPAPSALSLSSGSSGNSGQRPGTGYQAAAGFGAHTPFTSHTPFQAGTPFQGAATFQSNAAYGQFEKSNTPFSPVASFQPGAQFVPSLSRVQRGGSEGHLVSPTHTQGPFSSLNPKNAPSNASTGQQQQGSPGLVTGWAGERRAALAPQSTLRRFTPYAKPRDPVDEASVRALGGFPGV